MARRTAASRGARYPAGRTGVSGSAGPCGSALRSIPDEREFKEFNERLAVIDDGTIEAEYSVFEETQVQLRLDHQEQRRQGNMRAIVACAIDEAGNGDAPSQDVDDDWTARFFDHAKDVSNEDMQNLWAKVLAGEVRRPGRFSLRTLDILKNLSPDEARHFADLAAFVFAEQIVFHEIGTSRHSALPNIERMLLLKDCGLLSSDVAFSPDLKPGNLHHFRFRDLALTIRSTLDQRFNWAASALSAAGLELLTLVDPKANREHAKEIVEYFRGHQIHVVTQEASWESATSFKATSGDLFPAPTEASQTD